ncbi:ABC transporter permease [Philodulcilactobacillus myokoensis]|uniref:ABC transporter permease n=1 Tax=Philodulcilactobacillus myokoensis TaxID=2929573 RepID=A0A9W6B194_9LACO|nr:ECF transporter S component [Philodulcilactobacillus myokoensis]GLB46274.1 ABC transporter permease [Philodulcilactobacillus myokoensis]
MLKRWNLHNIIMLTMISILCGVIFWSADFFYNALTAALTPVGLAPMAGAALFGLWIIASPLCAMIFKIPGAAILSEVIGAIVEMILGGQWGIMTIVSGLVQGIGAELGFALTGYKMYNYFSLSLSLILTTTVTFIYQLFTNGYASYSAGLLFWIFIVNLISAFVFGGIIPVLIIKALKKSHLVKE